MLRFCFLALTLCLGAALPSSPARATEEIRFDVLFRGLTVAQGTIGANVSDSRYAVAMTARSTGLAAIFARVRLDMATRGAMTWPLLRPSRHTGAVDTGRREGEVTLTWRGQMPEIISIAPEPDAFAVPPTQARSTVDPLSALWRIARSTTRQDLCGAELQVYDGARRSLFAVTPPQIDGDSAACGGLYRRLAGYPPEDLEERQDFPFTAIYRLEGELWHLREVQATSLFGEIRVLFHD